MTFIPLRICFTAISTLKSPCLAFPPTNVAKQLVPRESDLLFTVHRDRDLGTFVDNGRNVSRAELRSDYFFDAGCKCFREDLIQGHFNKENDNLIRIASSSPADAQSIVDLGKIFQQKILDLRASKPDSSWLKHTIATTQHNQASSSGVEPDEIAVVPYPRKSFEVAFAVCFIPKIIPESDGLTGKWLDSYQITGLTCICHIVTFKVPCLHGHAQTSALYLSGIDR